MPLKVGLTGGIASGKSQVCQLFSAHYQIPIIDADLIARQLLKPGQASYQEVIDTFGEKIRLQNDEIDRPQLRRIIFNDSAAKQKLESILHPQIRQQLFLEANQAESPYCILAIPLLIESNMQSLVDRICVVDVDKQHQLTRLQERDKLSAIDAENMIQQQCSRQQRLSYAHDIINNNGDISDLNKQVSALDKQYRQLAS